MSNRLEPIIGVEIVDDIRLGHTWHEVNVLERFIKKMHPRYFFEIGVHEGGLSYVLIPKLHLQYVGVEIDCGLVRPEVKKLYKEKSALLFCTDCFADDLFDMIWKTKNKVIYCDGGNKALEISHFKSACQIGDLILCHDFYDGTRKVRDVPEANISIEVKASDIQTYETDPSFKRLPESIFRETRIVGWRRVK